MQRPGLGCLCEVCQKRVGSPGPQVIDPGSLQSGQLVYLCDVENVEHGRKALGTELQAWAHEQVCSLPRSKDGLEGLQGRSTEMTMWSIGEALGEKVKHFRF